MAVSTSENTSRLRIEGPLNHRDAVQMLARLCERDIDGATLLGLAEQVVRRASPWEGSPADAQKAIAPVVDTLTKIGVQRGDALRRLTPSRYR